jgi:hypothetical protein
MLHLIRDYADRFWSFLLEDPVRPQIPTEQRVGTNRDIFVLHDNDRVDAITCVSYQSQVPQREAELFQPGDPTIAVFYTIWSYHPYIKRFITLSPKTDMARRFHLRNGALICQENLETINYEYLVDNIR